MTAGTVRTAFAVRLYRWGLQEWDRELATGFPMLRSVRAPEVSRLLDLLSGLPVDEQRRLVAALMRRFHPEAVTALGDVPTDHDAVTLARWDSWRRHPAENEGMLGQAGGVDKKGLSRILRESLSGLGVYERIGAFEWRYVTTSQDWVVMTYVDLGGRFSDVTYHHDIGECERPPHMRFVSLISWLGVAGGRTRWKIRTDAEASEVAAALAAICRHFMAAVPTLTADPSGR